MASGVHGAAADGFGKAAAAYEASRPGYPPEVVERIAGRAQLGAGRRVLDLAAGTGKLTRLLAETGAEVVAVEPVSAMREQLRMAAPSIEVLDGTAEAIPLPADSVDLVTVAQAFHWFDATPALAELSRVLRPGGTLAIVFNERDTSVDWVRRFGDLLVVGDQERPFEWYYGVDYAEQIDRAGGFGPVEMTRTDWSQPTDPDLVVARAASVSVVGALDDDERAAVLDRVRELCRTHPQLRGRVQFGFPYRTVLYLTSAASTADGGRGPDEQAGFGS